MPFFVWVDVLNSVSLETEIEEPSLYNNYNNINIKKQSITFLRNLAKEKEIAKEEIINKMKKSDLIKLIEEN